MKKINFFFIHGWGFDSSFWSPVTTSFKKKYSYSISLFDLGFFGKERLNIKVEKGNINIFILHSYGLNWFLKQSYNADFIINFSGSPIFIDPKIENIFLKKKLERMIFMFEKTPKKVLEEFYHRCGLKSFSCNKTESHFNKKKMLCVLNNLLKDDLRDKVNNFECPMLSIYLKGDKIYDLLSAGSPFNFNEFKINKNKVTQTLLNHIDVTINQKQSNEIDLFVRRSFAEHLCSWMNDSARFI